MTWPACAPEAAVSDLELRLTADGSPTFWSARFQEGFHSAAGAWSEAQAKFVRPAELERFAAGTRINVLDVGVGLGYNSAALLEAAAAHGLLLQWWGLELDPQPLRCALADDRFRTLWQPTTLMALEQLQGQGHWQQPAGSGQWWLGDARQTVRLAAAAAAAGGGCHLVLHDAFSPGRCPELWSVEFLGQLAAVLAPEGRLLTYCVAAAVRQGLRQAGLQLASLQPGPDDAGQGSNPWSLGTVASPQPLHPTATSPYGPLTAMEEEHLRTRAAVPYQDPGGSGSAAAILAERRDRQQQETSGNSTSAWRRRWLPARGKAAGDDR